MTDLEKQIAALRYRPRVILRKTRAIYQATLRESRHIRASNFTTIAAEDVERLYRLYDETFFNGLFQRLAGNLFAHTAVRHELVTQREIAHRRFGIKTGDRVTFEYEGVRHTGIVQRITQRATVLVEDPHGLMYSDGKHYRKYYVPVPLLAPAPGAARLRAAPSG